MQILPKEAERVAEEFEAQVDSLHIAADHLKQVTIPDLEEELTDVYHNLPKIMAAGRWKTKRREIDIMISKPVIFF